MARGGQGHRMPNPSTDGGMGAQAASASASVFNVLMMVFAHRRLHASPLRHKAIQFQHHAPIRKLPLLVQDQDRSAGQEFKAAPPELRRQGTEPSRRFLVDSYTGQLKEYISEMERRVGNHYVPPSLNEFRQGSQNSRVTLVDVRTGKQLAYLSEMERSSGNRQYGPETDLHPETDSCPGEVISGKCYYFNPTPQTFSEAESSCKQFSPNGHLASVTTAELHARLVAMVSKANSAPVLTWLGGVLKEKQFRWTDGSSWGYSDWMPGHPDTATDRKTCLEMFRTDESWWTAVDCGLKRASVCSFSMTA
ncbi:aggrecan core protein [Chanos chanos]|uniref:Aggrecan core protein n=1 Tax=Chanos chanos TaxID=29144 RepID=A0A6J2VS25_CHACN|nr:aggrecan core protein-like [Chanos chanos]